MLNVSAIKNVAMTITKNIGHSVFFVKHVWGGVYHWMHSIKARVANINCFFMF